MDIVEQKDGETLEEKALKIGGYPLPLEMREKRFRELADLPLSAAGVRQLCISKDTSIYVALKADGVGTKILLAEAMQVFDTVGIDAVAMTANDVLCVGAKPILLVDYLAQNHDNPEIHKKIISGLEKGCEMAKAILVGGETATLGNMIGGYGLSYHFDLATACFGVFKKERQTMTGETIENGDAIIGLKSSGLHSNGYLWVRPLLLKEFNENAPYNVGSKIPSGITLGEELLKPTLIYVEPILKMLDEIEVKAISHITGGAYKIKLLRIAPPEVSFVLDNFPEPPWIFEEIKKQAKCSDERLFEALNMGIGMCVVVSKNEVSDAISICQEYGFEASKIGHVIKENESRVYIPSKHVTFRKV
jgi:phosphoribosylformylglycinamidine cyclo-ligase